SGKPAVVAEIRNDLRQAYGDLAKCRLQALRRHIQEVVGKRVMHGSKWEAVLLVEAAAHQTQHAAIARPSDQRPQERAFAGPSRRTDQNRSTRRARRIEHALKRE